MHGRFWMIAMLLSVLLVAVVLCFGFRSINNISSGKSQSFIQLPPEVVSYGRKAMNFLKQAPATEVVKKKLTEAGVAVNEATRKLTQ